MINTPMNKKITKTNDGMLISIVTFFNEFKYLTVVYIFDQKFFSNFI